MISVVESIIAETGLSGLWLDVVVSFAVTLLLTMSVVVIGLVMNRIEQLQMRLIAGKGGARLANFACNYLTFPGTVIHELSHAMLAMMSGAKVVDIKCFEIFSHGRLGHVDFILRGPAWKQRLQMALTSCAPVVIGLMLEVSLLRTVICYPLEKWMQISIWYLVISIADHMSMSNVDLRNYFRGLVFVFPMTMVLILAIKYFLL